jgi:hypothetical protein
MTKFFVKFLGFEKHHSHLKATAAKKVKENFLFNLLLPVEQFKESSSQFLHKLSDLFLPSHTW